MENMELLKKSRNLFKVYKPRKKFYLSLRNRFLTPFLQFEVKTPLEQIYIHFIKLFI